ncbi:unnamed protein product [Fusarium graminearum]|uniref:Chromosome 1, complete genome n=2 Tax=Gibberella zeae TaxID=5518 RepID=I1R9Y0_GIBZE|nr:hypothetical protein FGSG_00295 [Fusarium graminearum PH-1]EYB30604.1 hypothetical protein FG05_00295 [Fusarium graminearum]ESU05458.1 hypothetical protein FGSG_00295 [Fusarium graminearum PH-1]KAI6762005.1 hypothetical protein HG531_002558 [Fusarium graminearum]PCD18177.1 hypothetical protein FGRA07_06814 [Fusarium graminearum]CAF3501872.1 unnamed protein product [Fusarium graminearum]|eukprot:XP_011315943.1 hypothetical protein FGSG_00295 [Fusarium graminearum PH-1]
MGLIGLAISTIFNSQDNNGARSGGCCSRRNQTQQQLYTGSPNPDYMNYTGRSSCHQRKMERRVQRQLQRAERTQLRAEQRSDRNFQRAERRQAGVMLVKSGAQRVGLVGQPQVESVSDTMSFRDEPKEYSYELDAINQQHIAKDAPPSYDEVVRK